MTPYRILMIAPTPFFADRGCHVQIAEEVWALQRLGHEVVVVTYGLGREVSHVRTVRTVRVPWYKKFEAGPTFHKFYLDPLLFFTAWKTAQSFRPHILHGHLHEGALIGIALRALLRIPVLFDLQGSLTGEMLAHGFSLTRGAALKKLWYHAEEWIDRHSDIVVTQATDMRDELIRFFHVEPERVVMTYDGVNTNVFTPQEPDRQLLRSLSIPEGKRIIVYLGTLTSYQGIDDLLTSFPKVLSEIPNAFLLLMGYPNEEIYRQRIRSMGMEQHILVTGRIPYEEAARYLTLGEIAVSPKRSATEANGKIYNYMACGLPTVAFDTVVNHTILGELGVYARDLGDPAGLADAMIQLLKDPSRIQSLSRAVRERAVTTYSWDAVAQRLSRAYQKAQALQKT